MYAYGTYGSAAYSSRWGGNTLANGQLLFGRACYCVEGGLTMLRGCWSWTRYGDTSFRGVLGTGVPLNSPMVAPPAQHTAMRETSPMLSCSAGGHRQHSSVPRRRGPARGGAMYSFLERFQITLASTRGIRLHPRIHVVVVYVLLTWQIESLHARSSLQNHHDCVPTQRPCFVQGPPNPIPTKRK